MTRFHLLLYTFCNLKVTRKDHYEKDISTEKEATQKGTRIFEKNEDPCR